MALHRGQAVQIGQVEGRSRISGLTGVVLLNDVASGRCRVKLADPPHHTVRVDRNALEKDTSGEVDVQQLLKGSLPASAPPPLSVPPLHARPFHGQSQTLSANARTKQEWQRRALPPPLHITGALWKEIQQAAGDSSRNRLRNTGLSFFRDKDSNWHLPPVTPREAKIKQGSKKTLPGISSSRLAKLAARNEEKAFNERKLRLMRGADQHDGDDDDDDGEDLECKACQRLQQARAHGLQPAYARLLRGKEPIELNPLNLDPPADSLRDQASRPKVKDEFERHSEIEARKEHASSEGSDWDAMQQRIEAALGESEALISNEAWPHQYMPWNPYGESESQDGSEHSEDGQDNEGFEQDEDVVRNEFEDEDDTGDSRLVPDGPFDSGEETLDPYQYEMRVPRAVHQTSADDDFEDDVQRNGSDEFEEDADEDADGAISPRQARRARTDDAIEHGGGEEVQHPSPAAGNFSVPQARRARTDDAIEHGGGEEVQHPSPAAGNFSVPQVSS